MRQVAVLLQNLGEQVNEKTLNIIAKSIQVMVHYNYINNIVYLSFKALIEMCAGNSANQETAFKGHIVDSINLILKHLVENHGLMSEV